MTGICSEHGEGFVLLQKVFLFVRLGLVTRREGTVSPLGAVHEKDKRFRVPSVSHRIRATCFFLEHVVLAGVLQKPNTGHD